MVLFFQRNQFLWPKTSKCLKYIFINSFFSLGLSVEVAFYGLSHAPGDEKLSAISDCTFNLHFYIFFPLFFTPRQLQNYSFNITLSALAPLSALDLRPKSTVDV